MAASSGGPKAFQDSSFRHISLAMMAKIAEQPPCIMAVPHPRRIQTTGSAEDREEIVEVFYDCKPAAHCKTTDSGVHQKPEPVGSG